MEVVDSAYHKKLALTAQIPIIVGCVYLSCTIYQIRISAIMVVLIRKCYRIGNSALILDQVLTVVFRVSTSLDQVM